MMKPQPNEYGSFYKGYIDLVQDLDGIMALSNSRDYFLNTLRKFPESKAQYKYAPEKWTVNDLVQHIIDAEIVFMYRALCVARGDKTSLPGFEQDDYVVQAQADFKSLNELTQSFELVRNTTINLFKGFSNSSLENIGKASGYDISVRALGFIISGHSIHHANILNERYL